MIKPRDRVGAGTALSWIRPQQNHTLTSAHLDEFEQPSFSSIACGVQPRPSNHRGTAR